jgi:hypothetical protein
MPSKEESCKAIVDLILARGHNKTIYIAADCYGQEDIFLALHEKFGQQVVLDIKHTGISRRTKAIWCNWLENVPYLHHAVTEDRNSPSRFRACASNGKGVSKGHRENALNIFSLVRRKAESCLFIRASTLWFGSRERFETFERLERFSLYSVV